MSANQNLNGLALEADAGGGDFIEDEIPERLQDDLLVKYFRARFSERVRLCEREMEKHQGDEKQQKKSRDQQKRLEKEIARIEKLRETYTERIENKPMMDLFYYRRAKWRHHALEQRDANLKSLNSRLNIMQEKELEFEERLARKLWEQRILKNVEKWGISKEPSDLKPDELKNLEAELEAQEEPAKDSFFGRFRSKKKEEKKEAQKEAKTESKEEKKKKKREKLSRQKEKRATADDSYGITVNRITLRKNEPAFPSSYMSHDIEDFPLNNILSGGEPDNPLTKKCEPNTIRYFHFPANNMHWVEEAIARYYDEPSGGEFNYREAPNYRKKSSNILCREFWTSRQHGGRYDPIHARHMRAHCSLIMPQNPPSSEQGVISKNFVIFMPYLHWETHKRRKAMAKVAKEITDQHLETQSHTTESIPDEFYRLQEQIRMKHARQLTGFLTKKEREALKRLENGPRKLCERSPLADYLLQIAKLHDAMDIEHDVRILRDHLHREPPLHLRRTLDQSYYWKMSDTDGRDEDQVVYRATKEGKSILRTARVTMVDQLWLYVLDDNTVISFFPRRWGRNKPDYSGVHKGIRSMLNHLRPGQIESVYDLALLIMDQCSTVFFDKTKPVDERPELLDIFANALSNVSGQKTVAFETFWRHLDKMSSAERQIVGFEATARSYLNINPEGELLREAHDIIEELRMMARIYSHQLGVMDLFADHLTTLFNKERTSTPDETLNVLRDIKLLMEKKVGDEYAITPPLGDQVQERIQRINEEMNETATTMSSGAANSNPIRLEDNKEHTPPPRIPETTMSGLKRVQDHMISRQQKLRDLEDHAVLIADQLKDLLSLKQQQASIIEAKYALKRADESVNQGRSIMLFTIVTIVFLPLSFMSSVFGMNASDFQTPGGNGNRMTLREQFILLFPISFGVIFVSVALAFSPWIRCIIYYSVTTVSASIMEYSGLRRFWLDLVKKHEYDKTDGNKYYNRNPDDIYTGQQKKLERIYSRRERKAMKRDIDAAKKVEELARSASCVADSDYDTSSGSRHGSRSGFASSLFSPKSPVMTQGNGFGDDGDPDALEKGEWNCLSSPKRTN